jgi:hypothetical protein
MGSGAPPKDEDREAKLAQALRANLRRRKQAAPAERPKPAPPVPLDGDSA